MGARGPKPGWRASAPYVIGAQVPVQKPVSATSLYVDAAALPNAASDVLTVGMLSYSDRDNPNKLTGDALKDLAHRRGMAHTSLDGMSDVKIREQLRYIDSRQYEDA